MTEIVPAILTSDPDEFNEMLRSAEAHFSRVHLDIADGIFVPNTTINGIEELERIHTPLAITVHLMVANPENILEQWLKTRTEAFIFHIESTAQMDELISRTQAAGKKAGVALNPSTPIQAVVPFVDKADFIQFMTVGPGFYGSEFREDVLSKMRDFKQKYPAVKLWADGGINPATAKRVVQAGAEVLAVGSYFFGNGKDLDEALENMKKAVY